VIWLAFGALFAHSVHLVIEHGRLSRAIGAINAWKAELKRVEADLEHKQFQNVQYVQSAITTEVLQRGQTDRELRAEVDAALERINFLEEDLTVALLTGKE